MLVIPNARAHYRSKKNWKERPFSSFIEEKNTKMLQSRRDLSIASKQRVYEGCSGYSQQDKEEHKNLYSNTLLLHIWWGSWVVCSYDFSCLRIVLVKKSFHEPINSATIFPSYQLGLSIGIWFQKTEWCLKTYFPHIFPDIYMGLNHSKFKISQKIVSTTRCKKSSDYHDHYHNCNSRHVCYILTVYNMNNQEEETH